MHTRHLDDEHMRLYEWSGAGTGMLHALPAGTKRTHPWHASYGVLAVLTSLLILNGCDRKEPAAQAGEQLDQALPGDAGTPIDDAAPRLEPAAEAGPAPGEAGAGTGEAGADPQKP